MSIKEFSEKQGVKLFYTTIVLAILTIVFGIMAFSGPSIRRDDVGKFRNQSNQGMMQGQGGRQAQNNQQAPTQNNQTQTQSQQNVPATSGSEVPAGS